MSKKSRSRRAQRASRANGAKSRGPLTPEGKAPSCQSALKHGLSAEEDVLSIESQQDYAKIGNDLLRRYNPVDEIEMECIRVMVSCIWRRKRARQVALGAFELELDRQRPLIEQQFESVGKNIHKALAFKGSHDPNLRFYEESLDRQLTRAKRFLEELQSNRPEDQPHTGENQNPENEPVPKNEHQETSAFLNPKAPEPSAATESQMTNSNTPIRSTPVHRALYPTTHEHSWEHSWPFRG